MKSIITVIGIVGVAGMMTVGCEQDKVPDYGNVRIDNAWNQPVYLFLNEELKLTIEPENKKSVRVDEGLTKISIRDAAGKELFGQFADIPDNTFAEYIVTANGQVAATAGNIRRPDIVGGDDEQIKLENLAAFPVTMLVNNVEVARIAPLANATVDVPGQLITISFRGNSGKVLFTQTIDIPRNTVIFYTVLPDGTVIATGGPIDKNTDFDPDFNSF